MANGITSQCLCLEIAAMYQKSNYMLMGSWLILLPQTISQSFKPHQVKVVSEDMALRWRVLKTPSLAEVHSLGCWTISLYSEGLWPLLTQIFQKRRYLGLKNQSPALILVKLFASMEWNDLASGSHDEIQPNVVRKNKGWSPLTVHLLVTSVKIRSTLLTTMPIDLRCFHLSIHHVQSTAFHRH